MTNAIEVLRRDHEEVKRMLAELENGPVAAPAADKLRDKITGRDPD